MIKLKLETINNDSDRLKFVTDCEEGFNRILRSVAETIAADNECRAVTLAGPTCSGKTTAAAKLTAELEKLSKRARLISIDDFYRSRDELKRLGITDIEGAAAIDTQLFEKVSSDLSNFRKTAIPTFDFTLKRQVALTPYIPHENDIYIFEGIQAVYPEIVKCLSGFSLKKIFINVFDSVSVGNTAFSNIEIRLIRRIVRDFYHRASSVENTMELWESVRRNEEENIFPYIGNEDISLNSLIPYEVFLLGNEFLRLTESYSMKAPFARQVYDLRCKLMCIKDSKFSLSIVPDDSLIREFTV